MGGHHFVMVHGMGHGAWCWYKVSSRLQAEGHTVTALDLASSGINKIAADTITSVAEYLAPLTHFLAHSVMNHKVILVGHSLGGSSISYAMELFPEKVSKAIFINALMPLSGSLFLPPKYLTPLIDAKAIQLVNGSSDDSSKTTSIHLDATEASKYFYNKCSNEDVTLACACLNPTPFALTKEIIFLSDKRYGSIPRFYISCLKDLGIPASLQGLFIQQNPPQKVFTMLHSDHSPFLCDPTALLHLLLDIAHT
eukprot:c25225_g1_i3 orf=138-896(+)